MIDFKKLISEYSHCECGKAHECAIKDIVVEHGATERVGEILKKNGFPKNLLLVADKTTLKAAAGRGKITQGFRRYILYLRCFARGENERRENHRRYARKRHRSGIIGGYRLAERYCAACVRKKERAALPVCHRAEYGRFRVETARPS